MLLRLLGLLFLVGGTYFAIVGSSRDVGTGRFFFDYPHVPGIIVGIFGLFLLLAPEPREPPPPPTFEEEIERRRKRRKSSKGP